VWEVSQQYRLGVEFTHRKTEFLHLANPLLSLDNQGSGVQLHAAYKFGKAIQ